MAQHLTWRRSVGIACDVREGRRREILTSLVCRRPETVRTSEEAPKLGTVGWGC